MAGNLPTDLSMRVISFHPSNDSELYPPDCGVPVYASFAPVKVEHLSFERRENFGLGHKVVT